MKPVHFIIAVTGIVICLFLSLFFVANKLSDEQALYLSEDEAIRNSIAISINVDPTWEDIERYIYCEIAPAGRAKFDVEKDMSQIGDYQLFADSKSGLDEYVLYSFDDIRLHRVIYGVYVKYADDGSVADTMIRETQGAIESYEYKRFDCSPSVSILGETL